MDMTTIKQIKISLLILLVTSAILSVITIALTIKFLSIESKLNNEKLVMCKTVKLKPTTRILECTD